MRVLSGVYRDENWIGLSAFYREEDLNTSGFFLRQAKFIFGAAE